MTEEEGRRMFEVYRDVLIKEDDIVLVMIYFLG